MPLSAQAIADVVVLAVKSALAPVQAEVAALKAQLAALETVRERVSTQDERIVTLETRSAGPSVADMAVVEIRTQLAALQSRVFDDSHTKAVAAVSERVAVLETKAPVPGPAGKDGAPGRDGADGLGFDDFEEVQDDDGRTITRRYKSGDRVKEFVHKTAVELYRGVYVEGKTYERGDRVTWAGSEWHANETTTTKPGESKAWTLTVKRGRDGRDGRDAVTVPVVSVGGR
jgi:integrin beta 3